MKILRCTPTYYEVSYSINPHMKVGSVNKAKAMEQWDALEDVYNALGVDCEHIEGQPGLPDMVFSANQSLPFQSSDGKKSVIISNMAYPERQGEVPHYTRWFQDHGYEIHRLSKDIRFEGMGDVFYHADRSFFWGGYGFRTDLSAHALISNITGLPVRSLHLVDPSFYHLDTCLCVLNSQIAMIYRDAFDAASYDQLKTVYRDLLEVSRDEALSFACNAHCPDQKQVILQQGNKTIEASLRDYGFMPIPVDTGEFLKAGGSVSCLRLEL